MCYFWWESISTMLSVSFATETCYMIKEINKKIKKSFCRSKSPFCQCKLLFCWQKLRKIYFASTFFLPAQITILLTQIEKSQGKKNPNCKGCYSIHHVSLNMFQSLLFYSKLNKVCSNYVWILKWVNLHCNWVNLINVLSFPKQWVAD